jgi:AraC family transcriptional regulator
MYDVQIQVFPEIRVAGLAHKGPYTQISETFQAVAMIITTHQLWAETQDQGVGFYYDSPDTTPPEQLRAHAGFIVSGDVALPAPLEALIISAGRYAVLRHVGPYDGLPAAWGWLYEKWLGGSGEVLAQAAPFEININNPMNAAPADLITDICVKLG